MTKNRNMWDNVLDALEQEALSPEFVISLATQFMCKGEIDEFCHLLIKQANFVIMERENVI